MIANMVAIIQHFAGTLYEDVQEFPLSWSQTDSIESRTRDFTITNKNDLSFWLKMPDRQIENKDVTLQVSLVDAGGRILTEVGEDFRIGYLRNSFGRGQYYKLGAYRFPADFKGYLRYDIGSGWVPPSHNGLLVLRRSQPFSLPIRPILIFLAGILVLVTGIGTIVRQAQQRSISP